MTKQQQVFLPHEWVMDPRAQDSYRAIAGWFIDNGYIDDKHRCALPADVKTGVTQTARFISKRKVKGAWVDYERPGFTRYVTSVGGVSWYFNYEMLGDPRKLPPFTLPPFKEGIPRIVVDSDSLMQAETPGNLDVHGIKRDAIQWAINSIKPIVLDSPAGEALWTTIAETFGPMIGEYLANGE